MPFSNLSDNILSKDLCAGCGACELVCPKDLIKFNGVFAEAINLDYKDMDCGDCNLCFDVCPGYDPGTANQEDIIFGRTRNEEERWLGIIDKIYGGKSLDPLIFEKSSSGGSVTSLLVAASKYFSLDYILVMGRDETKPWRSAAVLVNDIENLVNYCQSTYQLAPYLGKLKELFRNDPEKSIGIVGVACHIQAIRKLQNIDGEIGNWAKSKIKFLIEIGCSSNTKPDGTESIITDILGLNLNDVKSIQYRDGAYPGEIVVRTNDGNVYSVPFWKAVWHFKNNKTHRCLSCADWMSGLADISVSDGDPNIFKASLGLNDIAKHGRIFSRTKVGALIIENAVKDKLLEIWDIELIGQNLGLDRKRNRRASFEMKDVPIPLPPIQGYLEKLEIISDEDLIKVTDKLLKKKDENKSF